MILHPAIIALLVSSALMGALVLYSSWYGVKILRHWDLGSGSGLQLDLERRTYLISTVLAYVFGFQLISLFLLIYTADNLCPLFTGAMCAAGTFNVNGFGYPLLLLKILNFILAGLWLIVNHADNRAYDYPLIRKKYAMLIGLAPLVVLEAVLQFLYFQGLRPDVITSCCGSLFSVNSPSVAGDLAALPARPMKVLFAVSMALTVLSGVRVAAKGRGAYLFAGAAGLSFLVGIASVLSFLSIAVYELPTHHCPFCFLQKEYGYIGYLVYVTLLGGAVSGVGTGLLMPFRGIASLAGIIPSLQKRLTVLSLAFYSSFALLTIIILMRSNLIQ